MTCFTLPTTKRMTYQEYQRQYPFLTQYKTFFENMKSLDAAIKSVYRQPDGSLHPHQTFHGIAASESEVISRLSNNKPALRMAKDFEELYAAVKGIIKDVDMVGDVAIYDVTLRLGFYLNILPAKYVYLHAGAKEGYRQIVGGTKLPYRVEVSSMPPMFHNIEPYLLEDYFCISKR